MSVSVTVLLSLTWQDVDISVLFFILFLGSSVTWCLDGADWQRLKHTGKNTHLDNREEELTDAFQFKITFVPWCCILKLIISNSFCLLCQTVKVAFSDISLSVNLQYHLHHPSYSTCSLQSILKGMLSTFPKNGY